MKDTAYTDNLSIYNTPNYRELLSFYKGKRVLISGNTGFKGSWLTHLLVSAGAEVTGYALKPPANPNLFSIAGLDKEPLLVQHYADVRHLEKLKKVFKVSQPEIVFHLAAQPIVKESFRDPVNTYSTNVMGTVNMCECVRLSKTSILEGGLASDYWNGVISFLNVTTDKVYRNDERNFGYRETDFLDGCDPYSNSKSCSELVTHSYKDSFFQPAKGREPAVRISTARAGNVIGGGDFSNDRIIPDCVRALLTAQVERTNKGTITVRNPLSIRPYEHVLEPLFAYLLIAKFQYEESRYAGYYNIGPDDVDCVSTGELVDLFCHTWNESIALAESKGRGNIRISHVVELVRKDYTNLNKFHEANILKLDCSKFKRTFNWKPTWHISTAIDMIISWTKVWMQDGSTEAVKKEMDWEIEEFIK